MTEVVSRVDRVYHGGMSNDTTFWIPAENLPTFKAKMERLAKRARRIGVPAPTWTVLGHEDRPVTHENGGNTGRTRRYTEVAISGETPKFSGWTFAAAIDLDTEDNINVVHATSSTDYDPAWVTMTERCDHCHVAKRGRRTLVVVTHENGTRKVIGTTCLQDFLGGATPAAIAQWATYLADLRDIEDDDEIMRSSGGALRWETLNYLAWVALVIEADGWTPRSQASAYRQATADVAVQAEGETSKSGQAPMPTDAHREAAKAALAWAQAIDPGDNGYLNNVTAVARKTSLLRKHYGIAASIISAHQREIERTLRAQAEANANAEAAGSTHVGTPGERMVITGTVVHVRYVEGDYGTRALVKILDQDGNQIAWWASDSSRAPEQGEKVTGKATVKKHDEYRGVRETTVTRFAWAPVAEAAA